MAIREIAPPSEKTGRPPWRWLVLGALVVTGFVGAEAARVLLGENVHVLVPGRVYRCAQPSPEMLHRLVEQHGIRTVVNLRGCCEGFPWYEDECRATQELDIAQEDVSMSAGRLPSPQSLRRLVEVLDRAAYPILLHCRRGADRTGLAAAVVVLLQSDAGLAEARRQMGIRFGHLALGRPAELDRLLDIYADWLRGRNAEHTRLLFRRWALNEYTAGETFCQLEWLEKPGSVRAGESFAVRLRAHNVTAHPWRMSPSRSAGVHVCYLVWDDTGRQVDGGRAGLFEAEVAAGESVEVTVPLSGLSRPGRYRLFLDLIDERRCLFFQTGSEPLEEEFVVRD
jgi:protein tyrosine phosphatase (PTP) superfamily phosphohydrolase (DUF442 family)